MPLKLPHVAGVLRPDAFHGHGRPGPFFEGWYHKLVTADRQTALAIILGWYRARGADGFPFLMLLDGRAGAARYVRLDPAGFEASDARYDVRIAGCHFTPERLDLDLSTPELSLRGSVTVDKPRPWPVTLASPGCMGWYGWVPFMQCFHGVVSLDHALQGTLEVDGEPLTFDGGRGYVEKDWGRGFPSAWVWLQCNHFSTPGTSLMISVATIPWVATSFGGFLAALWHEGELLRFTTYVGARVEQLDVDTETVHLRLRGRGHVLEVTIHRGQRVAMLHAPDDHDMVAKVPEALDATVDARLLDLQGATLWASHGDPAALEVMGSMDDLRRLLGL